MDQAEDRDSQELTRRVLESGLLEPEAQSTLQEKVSQPEFNLTELRVWLSQVAGLTDFQLEQLERGGLLRLGPYRLLDRLGRGGMGEVLLGYHELMQRQVAIKTMEPRWAEDATMSQRFVQEIVSAAKLSHPNIVTTYDAGEDRGRLYLAMEHIAGQTLENVVQGEGQLSWKDAAEVVAHVADALQFAHEHEIVHRDVKPANIMVSDDGTVRVMDLGLARAMDQSGIVDRLTQEGSVMGTADYLAPEQARDASKAGPSADIYGLGCTLYFCLTGEPPYPGGSLTEKLLRHVSEPPPSASQLCDAPTPIIELTTQMMQKEPPARPTDMRTVAHRLRELANASITSDTPQPAVSPPGSLVSKAAPSDNQGTLSAVESTKEQARTITDLGETVSLPKSPASGSPQATSRIPYPLLGMAFGILLITGILWAIFANGDVDQSDSRDAVEPEQVAINPFDQEQAKRHQRDWAAYYNSPPTFKNSVGMELVFLPPGEYQAGTSAAVLQAIQNEDSELWGARPAQFSSEVQRKASVKAFYMGATEVTVAQFRKFCDETSHRTSCEKFPDEYPGWGFDSDHWYPKSGYSWRSMGDYKPQDECPVTNVSWHDAQAFCKWLSDQEDRRYRLPSEDEWEFACRAGSNDRWPFGDEPDQLKEYAWFHENGSNSPQPVATRSANAFGLFDMLGNEWEWCSDTPSGRMLPPGELRVLRGGNFLELPTVVRSASRDWGHPHSPQRGGFRVVCEIK